MSFRIKLARMPQDIRRVISIRPEKYARRAPDYLDSLYSAESEDVTPGAVIVFAEDIRTGEVLGTLRLESNFSHPLKEELIDELSTYLPKGRLLTISRLVILSKLARSDIKYAMFKAATKICQVLQVNWVIVTALPPMDQQFVHVLAFDYLMPSEQTFAEPGFPDRRFCLLGLEVSRFSEVWEVHNPKVRKYFLEDHSPELELFSSLTSTMTLQRRTDRSIKDSFADRMTLPDVPI